MAGCTVKMEQLWQRAYKNLSLDLNSKLSQTSVQPYLFSMAHRFHDLFHGVDVMVATGGRGRIRLGM